MLVLPGSPAFQWCKDNLEGGSSLTPGSTITAGSPANTASSALAIGTVSPLAKDACLLVLEIGSTRTSTSAIDRSESLDIVVDPAGGTSYSSLIDNIIMGGFDLQPGNGNPLVLWFPVWIPAGAAIALQFRAANISPNNASCRVLVRVFGEPRRPEMWWCGQKVETLGGNAAASKGTDVTPGASNSFGSWTTIGTSTRRYGAVAAAMQVPATTTVNLANYSMEIGYGSSKLLGSPLYYGDANTTENMGQTGYKGTGFPIFCDVAASTTWQARMASSVVSPQNPNACIYGVY